jgi:hypothetical protein
LAPFGLFPVRAVLVGRSKFSSKTLYLICVDRYVKRVFASIYWRLLRFGGGPSRRAAVARFMTP